MSKTKAIELYEDCYTKLPRSLSETVKHVQAVTFAKLIANKILEQSVEWSVVSVKAYWKNVIKELENI